jgi:hypothetical protein
MFNDVLLRYNSHPERICIINNGIVVHEGGKGPLVFYDIEGVIAWLDGYFGYDPAASDEAVSGASHSTDGTAAGTDADAEPAEAECSA